MTDEKRYASEAEIQWCPGCPNFGILNAFKKALTALDIAPHELCLVSGIGQAAKFPHYIRCNFFNGLHGRAIPAALGIHAANPHLTTIVTTGEGDCYGEGGNHFLHALRRNPDITVVVHNNEFYALTKGQASPTTQIGERRSLHRQGVEAAPVNMPAMAILNHCSFVAIGFAGDPAHLAAVLTAAVKHRGLSFVEVVQPCITWGRHPVQRYRERMIRLGADHDPTDRRAALGIAMDRGERIPAGILYQGTPGRVFAERFRNTVTGEALATLKPVSGEVMTAFMQRFKPAPDIRP